MTAPTPDMINFARASRMLRADLDRGDWEHGANWAHDMRMILDAADALAAVTAERDQARQMLADAPHGLSETYALAPCGLFGGRPCDCWKGRL